MKNRTPTTPDVPVFEPVPRRRKRMDGWTPERQYAFIEALAETGSVTHAAARVNMAAEGAYQLRRAAGSEDFCHAWHVALDHGVQRLEDIALERAIHGVEVPVYSYGKLVGTRIVHNDRLLMFILRNRAADRFSAGASGKRLTSKALATLQAEWKAEYDREIKARGAKSVKDFIQEIDLMKERQLAHDAAAKAQEQVEQEKTLREAIAVAIAEDRRLRGDGGGPAPNISADPDARGAPAPQDAPPPGE